MVHDRVYLVESVQVGSINYNFSIIESNLGSSMGGHYLCVNSDDRFIQDRCPSKIFKHYDLDHLKKVREAAIDGLKNNLCFIMTSGDSVFKDLSLEISGVSSLAEV